MTQKPTDPKDEHSSDKAPDDDEAQAMEEAQEEAAQERKDERGYQ